MAKKPKRKTQDGDSSQSSELALAFTFGAIAAGLISVLVRIFQLSKQKEIAQVSTSNALASKDIQLPAPKSKPTLSPSKMGFAEAQAVSAQEETAPAALRSGSSPRWSTTTKYVMGIWLFLAILFMVYIGRDSLSLIIVAGLIAFVVRPVVGFFRLRLKMGKGGAVILTYLLVILAMILIPLIVVPAVINMINSIISFDYQTLADNLASTLSAWSLAMQDYPLLDAIFGPLINSLDQLVQGTVPAQPQPVEEITIASVGNQLAQTLGRLAGVLGPIVSAVLSLVFMLLISLHMSLAGSQIKDWYSRVIPPLYAPELLALLDRIVNLWSSFLRGQLALMLIIGLLVWLGNIILGTPYPAFLGLIAGLLEVIPSLGPFLATIPAVILALAFGSTHFAMDHLVFALLVILLYLVIQTLENQLIVPLVLGDAVNLPPLVVVVGVVIFGGAFGILGVFLATPVIATFREVFQYIYDKILEPPEVGEPPDKGLSLFASVRNWGSSVARGVRQRFGRTGEVEGAPDAIAKTEDGKIGEGKQA